MNLAIGLARLGRKVGLLDADVYGPNVPTMMGTRETPMGNAERIRPIEKFGVKLMSMGFLNPGDKPLVWRGPMLHNVMQQFLRNVEWGELDYLIIDLPPGTGDVALSLVQNALISGAIVVTTPSDVSLEDARKAVNMFAQVRVPILGMVENMSYLIAPGIGERIDVFGQGGGKKNGRADEHAVPGRAGARSRCADRRGFGQSGDHTRGRGCARHAVSGIGEARGSGLRGVEADGSDGHDRRLGQLF